MGLKREKLALERFQSETAFLVKMFCMKQDAYVDYTIGDDICGIYEIGDNYFSLDDIYFDLKTDQPKGLIFDWQNANIDAHFKGIKDTINYRSWCMGLRFEHIKKSNMNKLPKRQ